MASFCIHGLKQLRQENMPDLLTEVERVLAQEGASCLTMMKLLELFAKHALPANQPRKWLNTLETLRGADNLAALFHRVDSVPQAPARLVSGFVEIVLLLCKSQPAEIEEICRTLGALLDKAETLQLLTNLTALENVALASSLLTTVRQQQDQSILVSCTELSGLLASFERDHVQPPDLLPALRNRAEELTKLVRACVPIVQNPAHHMTGLIAMLLGELNTRPTADLLIFIAATVMDLLGKVEADRIEELGQELTTVSRDAAGEERVRKLQGQIAQIRGKLEELLRGRERISLQTLEQLLPKYSQAKELVHVSASALRFFNFQTSTWGAQVNLKATIQADNYSSWVILEDGRVFCCGGEY